MMPGPFTIRIKDRERELVAVKNLEFASDKITFLFGESGIGKTLLAKTIYGLLNPAELDITVNESGYRKYLQNISTTELQQNSFFVFQEPSSHLNPMLPLREQLQEGSLKNPADDSKILKHLWQGSEMQEVHRILDTFPKPYRPSGGEKQRVLLTMAFKKIQSLKSGKTSFFVFDEPTGNLDNHYRNLALELIFQYFKYKPYTLLFITHDYTIIHEIYKRYRAFLPFIEFRELYRQNGAETALRSFSAEDYLQWEQNLQPPPPAKSASKPLLTFESRVSVFGRELRVFRDAGHSEPADLQIYPGSLVYLKAPSGTGKTTLAKIILGLIKPQKFSAQLEKFKLNENSPANLWAKHIWGKQVAMVFQHADESLNRKANILQTFSALPLKKNLTPAKLASLLDPVFAEKIDPAFLNRKIGHLSGGQKQRVNILRSLILDTPLIILDEPLNGLDFHSIRKIVELIEQKRRLGAAFLIISHNEDIFDRLVQNENIYYLA